MQLKKRLSWPAEYRQWHGTFSKEKLSFSQQDGHSTN